MSQNQFKEKRSEYLDILQRPKILNEQIERLSYRMEMKERHEDREQLRRKIEALRSDLRTAERIVLDLITCIPDKSDQTIARLRYAEGMTDAQISRIIHRSVASISRRSSRYFASVILMGYCTTDV